MKLVKAFFLASSLSVIGCDYFSQKQFDLNVVVKNSEQEPIEAANIYLDGESLGQTGDTGTIKIPIKTSNKSALKIEVKKESVEHYFAPYYQTINPEDIKNGNIIINAILFSVPKSQKFVADKTDATINTQESVSESKEEIAFESTQKDAPITFEKIDLQSNLIQDPPQATSVKDDIIENVKAAPLPVIADEKIDVQPPDYKPSLVEDKFVKFSFYVSSDKGPITGAKIISKDEGLSDNNLCTTNQNGRCQAKVRQAEGSKIQILVKAEKYVTQELQVKLSEGGKKRVVLERGLSLDVATYVRRFDYASSLQGVKVFIDEKPIGETNSAGFFTSILPIKKDQLLRVRLESKDFLPKVYDVELVVGGPLFIERYFTPKTPPKVHVSIVPILPAGEVTQVDLKGFEGRLDSIVYESLNTHLFAKQAFSYFPIERVDQGLAQAQISINQISEKGWRSSSIANQLDALIIPIIEMSVPKKLSFNFVNRDGEIVQSTQTVLTEANHSLAIDKGIKDLAEKIIKNFPFEGAITRVEANNVWINIGKKSLRGIRPKDEVEIYSTQLDAFGQKRDIVKIAVEEVFDVGDNESHVIINSALPPRTYISVGDLVVTRPRVNTSALSRSSAELTQEILVSDQSRSKSENKYIGQVNVYLNENWLGATNEKGQLQLRQKLKKEDKLRFVKPGYGVLEKTIDEVEKNRFEFELKRNTALLVIDTVPGALEVYADDVKIGTSPLNKTIQVAGSFVNLKVKAPKGYIDFNRIIEITGSEVNLGKNNKLILQKDILGEAKILIGANKFSEAIKILAEIERNHADYLNSWHLRGDLLLTKLENPFEAAKSYGVVTADKEVKNFNNKKYISSHINEGIALVKAAMKFQENKDQIALPTLVKASSTLENVQPYLHFISKDRYEEAVLSVSYYKALSQHLIWIESKDEQMKELARKSWQQHSDYLETYKNEKNSAMTISFKESAVTYIRQLDVSNQKGTL
ncbi:MAG: hypothetical protein KBD78_01835 [Oligoflexales bacterium]|nr:hypothetical protein [Oligoflexales bacterium]